MLKNTIKMLRDNEYEGLKETIFITNVLLTSAIAGKAMFKFAPIIVGTGLVGQASLIALCGGAFAILPPIVVLIHKKIF